MKSNVETLDSAADCYCLKIVADNITTVWLILNLCVSRTVHSVMY